MSSTSSPESLRPTSPSHNIPPPIDLRHMTSNVVVASPTKEHHRAGRRVSQHLRTTDARLGSPNSIPSSPTSVHSSSSAIFERDIEPIAPPSPPSVPHHPPNPHRIPRAKTTEQLEQSVPSVLDSAAAILAGSEETDGDQVSVVSPVSASLFEGLGRSSGFASPMSFRSRSPSPLGSRAAAAAGRTDLLLSIPSPIVSPTSAVSPHLVSSVILSPPGAISPLHSPSTTSTTLSSSSPRTRNKVLTDHHQQQHQPLAVATAPSYSSTTPSLVTPTSAYFSTTSSVTGSASGESSPTTTTREHPPPFPIPAGTVSPNILIAPSPLPTSASPIVSPISLSTSHPPSPIHGPTKRLSFMSYSDLLSSTPASTHPLSSLTTSASTSEPPPHIPSVSGLNIVSAAASAANANASTAGSLRGFSLVPLGGLTHAGKRDSIALLDNVGGEWEREGLGRGLEERLDALVIGTPAGIPAPLPPYVGGGKA